MTAIGAISFNREIIPTSIAIPCQGTKLILVPAQGLSRYTQENTEYALTLKTKIGKLTKVPTLQLAAMGKALAILVSSLWLLDALKAHVTFITTYTKGLISKATNLMTKHIVKYWLATKTYISNSDSKVFKSSEPNLCTPTNRRINLRTRDHFEITKPTQITYPNSVITMKKWASKIKY